MTSRVTINPRLFIGISVEKPDLCNRVTCRFTGTRHVCTLFQQQLVEVDEFDEHGNRMLRRCMECIASEATQ